MVGFFTRIMICRKVGRLLRTGLSEQIKVLESFPQAGPFQNHDQLSQPWRSSASA
jgi:hypothetical protein